MLLLISMSRPSAKTICKYCEMPLALRPFVRHLRYRHPVEYEGLEKEFHSQISTCHTCKKEFNPYIIVNNFILGKKIKNCYCSQPCVVSWNKGLTKKTDQRLKNISESRTGENNPIFKVLNDPEKKAKWLATLNTPEQKERKRKVVEGFSKEKRLDNGRKGSLSWEKNGRRPRGMTGKFHSEETKTKLRESTSRWISKMGRSSELERNFYSEVCKEIADFSFVNSYHEKYYTIDIANLEYKIAIEVDGDFFHSNEERGYPCESKIQKRNRSNDLRKNKFLRGRGWIVLRFWESDIRENASTIIQSIKKELDEISKNQISESATS